MIEDFEKDEHPISLTEIAQVIDEGEGHHWNFRKNSFGDIIEFSPKNTDKAE